LGRYCAQIIRAGKLEARPFFFLNFKGTPSQEEQKTIFGGLTICKMALTGQIDSPASIPEYDNPLSPLHHKMTFRRDV
jgi:hypothetical protein